jgi:Na+/H+ antiporter NhaD/arsenite permease-like protein
MAAPITVAGVLMVWRHERARHYVESNVEWWTLLFFMMLFAKAGTLEHTGVTDRVAAAFTNTFAGHRWMLTPVIMFASAVGSAFVDNVVFVAAFIPVVRELGAGTGQAHPFWWALLFGACFGGNITMIGSTANIVALGMMEKRYRTRATFMEWLKVGLLTGLVACLVAWLCLLLTGPLMLRLGERQSNGKSENPIEKVEPGAPSAGLP